MDQFDFRDYRAEQDAFQDRCGEIWLKHVQIFQRFPDQKALERALDHQLFDEKRVAAWNRDGQSFDTPKFDQHPNDPVQKLLDDYAGDIKNALGRAGIYRSEPSLQEQPATMLFADFPQDCDKLSRIEYGIHGFTGERGLDQILRAASPYGCFDRHGGQVQCPGYVFVDFNEDGSGELSDPVYVYKLEADQMRPVVRLTRTSSGNVIPEAFSGRWSCPGTSFPVETFYCNKMDRQYFVDNHVTDGDGFDMSKQSSQAAGRTISWEDAHDFLTGQCKKAERELASVGFATLTVDQDKSEMATYMDGSRGLWIGIRSMVARIQNEHVLDTDLFNAAEAVYHERRHVYQYDTLFKKQPGELSPDERNMAVMEACAMTYRGYYEESYGYRLSELDACQQGTKDAIAALSERFPDTDWNEVAVRAINDMDQEYDAAVLSGDPDRTASTPHSRVYRQGNRYADISSVYRQYEAQKDRYLFAAHKCPCDPSYESDKKILDQNGWDEKFRELLAWDGDAKGLGRDWEILASALQAGLVDLDNDFPALRDMPEKLQGMYGLDTGKTRSMKFQAFQMARIDRPEADGPQYA